MKDFFKSIFIPFYILLAADYLIMNIFTYILSHLLGGEKIEKE